MILAVDLSYLSYLNFIFYFILALAILIGFARGLKKTLFNFVMMAIFYVVFFLTINQAVNFIWTFNMPWLGSILGGVDPALSGFTTFENSLGSFIELGLGGTVNLDASSAEVIALATGIMQFVIKIVWTILYFTVILLVYKILCFIISLIFLRTKKEAGKNRGLGALFGALNGAMAIFVTMIVLGGFMSTAESALVLLENTPETTPLSFDGRFDDFTGDGSIIPLADTGELDTYVADLQGMVDGYNTNLFVQLANKITTPSTLNSDIEVPLHIDLFDQVLSFNYEDNVIGIRYELAVFSNAAAVLLESDFMTTNNVTDITGDEIRDVFATLSESNLIVSLLPAAIELAADNFDQDLNISHDELYAIDFETELANLGSIAGALFDVLNGAGFIGGEGSVDQITIDGDAVRDIFSDIAGSEVIVLITENLLFPMLEDGESGFSAIITIPADLDIQAEYLALGEIFAAIIDADIQFADLADADVTVLLSAVSEIDLTVLLDSKLVTEALINILSGDSEIEGLDMLTIPADIVWRDTYDLSGEVDQPGELRNILIALNGFIDAAGELDFNNLDINTLLELDDAAIDNFFGSYVIRATVSEIITGTELGDTPLLIPDSVYDDLGYFTETELINVVKAIKLILADVGTDFDIMKALDLTDTQMDTLLASDILHATIGQVIYDLGTSTLVVPDAAVTTVDVDGSSENIITKLEIKAILNALSVLGITDFDTMAFDATIINNLENDAQDDLDDVKIATLLDSSIIHATISDVILDLDTSNGGVLIVPSLGPTGANVVYTVGTTEYITESEIGNVLKALYTLDISDFNNIDLEDTGLLLTNLPDMIDSNIIHATVSDIVLGLAPAVIVPEEDVLEQPITIVQGTTTYIDQTELQNMLVALDLLGMESPTDFVSSFDLSAISTETDQDTLLDSAIMHATISKTMFDLGSSVLIIPIYQEDGLTKVRVETGSVGNETEYIVKAEIKALIDAFNTMGFSNLESFGTGIDTSLFLDNATEILASHSLQATLSNQVLTSSSIVSGNLIVPDKDDTDAFIRIEQSDVTYIRRSEMESFIHSINLLDITDFDSFDFIPDDLFDIDYVEFIDSYIMQATVSSKILLSGSTDEMGATSGTLIVPQAVRQNIEVDSIGSEWIEKVELTNLLTALNLLNVTNFEGDVSGNAFGTMSSADLDTLLLSGSMHITIDFMLESNASISASIPNLALVGGDISGSIYGVTNVVTAVEVRKFILGVQKLGGDITASVDFSAVSLLSGPDRDIVIDSMIIRTKITPELVSAMVLNGTPYVPADYEVGSVPQFLTFTAAKSGLDTLYP